MSDSGFEGNSLNPADDDDQLADQITLLAGKINAANYHFLKLIAEFDRRQAWAGYGIRSCAHWLNLQCGIATSAARERVRVARALDGFPGINSAFEKGELSFSKVRAMTRVATEENESFLLMIAEHGTAQHMEKLVRKYRCVSRQSDFEEQNTEIDQQEHREVVYYQDMEGMWIVHAKLPAEEGGLLVKALNAIVDRFTASAKSEKNASSQTEAKSEVGVDSETDANSKIIIDALDSGTGKVSAETFSVDNSSEEGASSIDSEWPGDFDFQNDRDNDSPTMEQRRADALAALAEHFIAGGDAGHGEGISSMASLKGAERCQLILHVRPEAGYSAKNSATASCDCCSSFRGDGNSGDEEKRAEAESQANCHLHCELDGYWLPPDAAKMLSCDASLLVVQDDEFGNVLDLGRRTRIISAALSRALAIRDGGCQFPGCCESRYVDGHHIIHWGNGGETKLDNLVTLCRFHHRELHRGKFFLTLKPATQQLQRFADRLHFTKGENGETIEENPSRLSSDGSDFSAFQGSQSEAINAQTAVTKWTGEHMDYGMGVDALFQPDKLL